MKWYVSTEAEAEDEICFYRPYTFCQIIKLGCNDSHNLDDSGISNFILDPESVIR
jgi:hypothetical protein